MLQFIRIHITYHSYTYLPSLRQVVVVLSCTYSGFKSSRSMTLFFTSPDCSYSKITPKESANGDKAVDILLEELLSACTCNNYMRYLASHRLGGSTWRVVSQEKALQLHYSDAICNTPCNIMIFIGLAYNV